MKTTADVPPQVANEYSKATRGQAVSEATGDGYTQTKAMQKGAMPGKGSKQFGLPMSPGKRPPAKVAMMPDATGKKPPPFMK
jgi:hypothetical protein